METPELTLLTEGQIWGMEDESQLEVMKKYGSNAAVTDLAILTGSYFADDDYFNIDEDKYLSGRTGSYWTKSDNGCGNVRVVGYSGIGNFFYRYQSSGCVRPVLKSPLIFSKVYPNRVSGYNGTEEVEYGEYPQMAANSSMQEILEREYQNGIKTTGRTYTFDSRNPDDYYNEFNAVTYYEYEYQGKKYIRVMANSDPDNNAFKLSNGVKYVNGNYVWLEVSPVKWLIDNETETLISKKCLVSGIRFLILDKYYDGDFSKTEMKEYLDKYMSRDLFQNIELLEQQINKSIIESDLSEEEKRKIHTILTLIE